MKKHFLMLMLAGMMAFTACGNTDTEETNTDQVEETADDAADTEDTEEGNADDTTAESDSIPVVEDTVEDLGIDAFMTAGDYMGVQVSEDVITVTEEDVDAQISTNLSSYPLVITDTESTVEIGDTVNLDYSGSMDGVVFDGGTAEGYDLVIGSGSFIDDFEEQLVGMHVGEDGEVEVTFPDPYDNNPDFAGKDAVFTVKINQIKRTLTEVNEEWLAANAEGKTEEEYRQSIKETLEKSNKSSAAMTNFCETVEFLQFPQDRVDYCLEQMQSYYEMYASMYGMTYEDFIAAMGMTEDDVLEEAKNAVRNWLVLDYVCEKEGVTAESDIYQQYQKDALEGSGFSTLDDALAAGVSEWDIDYSTKNNYVVELIAENVEIIPAEQTAEDAAK